MPSQPCGLHRRHSRIESVVPYTSAPAKKGQGNFGSWDFAFSQMKPAEINLSLFGRSVQ